MAFASVWDAVLGYNISMSMLMRIVTFRGTGRHFGRYMFHRFGAFLGIIVLSILKKISTFRGTCRYFGKICFIDLGAFLGYNSSMSILKKISTFRGTGRH